MDASEASSSSVAASPDIALRIVPSFGSMTETQVSMMPQTTSETICGPPLSQPAPVVAVSMPLLTISLTGSMRNLRGHGFFSRRARGRAGAGGGRGRGRRRHTRGAILMGRRAADRRGGARAAAGA